MWTDRRRGVVAVHGEIDIATHHLFATVVEAVTNPVGGTVISPGEAQLDLADVDFIDSAGARVLVAAAANRGPDDQLVVRHPPAMLVKILQLGWGQLPGLRCEE
jgi:anti-anti-sigma factor